MFTYLQRKLGISDLTATIEQDHRERDLHWEVVTARWKELCQHLKQMEVQMQEQQAQLRRYELTTNALPEIKDVPLSEKSKPSEKIIPRQATLQFYDRILKHLPQVRSIPVMTLAERLKCSQGRVSEALSRLLEQGKVERTGKGMYRKICTEEGEK